MFADPTELPSLLPSGHTATLVALSVVVAIIASFVALDVASRIWRAQGPMRAAWIVAAATAMGGGIWSMHFIAMLAFALPVPIAYDVGLTLISLALAIGVTGISFALIAGSGSYPRLLLAGLVMGLGVVAMHYTGMEAMLLPATLTYEPWLFTLSVVVAITAATTALWLATRVTGTIWQIGAAILMGIAVCGMHYIGMEAACFSADFTRGGGALAFEQGALAVVVAVGTLVILLLEFVSALVDRRFTAYRDREIALMQLSAQRLKGLIQATNDLILVVDGDDRIDFAGPSAEAAIGRPPEALVGLQLGSLLDPGAERQLRQAIATLAPDARLELGEPVRLALPDGTYRVFDVSVTNLTMQPAVRGLVMTFHDVTVRQQAADKLQSAKEMADEANRMKTQFMANMSHELRTPLNAVIGLSELLVMEIDGPLGSPQYRDYAADIKTSGLRLLAVINDVLDIARLEANEVVLREADTDPLALALEANSAVAVAAAEKGIDVTIEVADRQMLYCDRQRIVQILAKLLSNAVKFSNDNARVALAGRVAGDSYEFTVDDDGIGISPEAWATLFEPFSQADGSLTRRHEGTGLGLPIALNLARLHGGRVALAPRAEGGTRAMLILPFDRMQAAA